MKNLIKAIASLTSIFRPAATGRKRTRRSLLSMPNILWKAKTSSRDAEKMAPMERSHMNVVMRGQADNSSFTFFPPTNDN